MIFRLKNIVDYYRYKKQMGKYFDNLKRRDKTALTSVKGNMRTFCRTKRWVGPSEWLRNKFTIRC